MNCPRCDVVMVKGQAIRPKYEDACLGVYPLSQSVDQVELIPCLKCPQCGHSDDGR